MKKRNISPVAHSQPVATAAAALDGTHSKWFYGSFRDLIIGCGAWSAPLLLLAYYCSSNYPQGVSIAFYGLALIFNYPHYMATIYRAYRTHEDFVKYKIFTLHLTALVGLLIILTHVSYQLLAVLFTLYLTWSPFHYTGQNFGIALLFARRNGVKTTRGARRAFYLAFLASYAMFFLAVHSLSSTDQFIISLGIPLKAARILWVAMLGTFIVSAVSSLSAFVKQTGWRAMTAPIVLLSTQVAWFVIPTALTLFSNVDFLQARSTAGILAVMHSAQYLWITSYYARRESQVRVPSGQTRGAAPQLKHWRVYAYFAVLVIGGIALFVPGPWLASRMLHIDFSSSFLAFTALVNIHHFLLDGAIWKLRDGRIAALLLNTQRVENGERVDSRFTQFTGWLTSPRRSARLFRVAAALGLLLVAGLDQVKFYYGAQASDAASLRRAQQLNPYDAALDLRLARANQRDGNQMGNRAALEQAVRVNPTYRQAQVSLAKLLIESGEYEAAYAHYEQMFAHLRPDVDSLVNFGVLASQLNHQDEAINAWQRALKLDASQANARLYLAEALVKKKQYKEAIPHYEGYLTLVADGARASAAHASLPNPDVIVKVVLQLAATCQNAGEDETALQFFAQGATLAERIGDKPGLTFALINGAEIEARHGQRAEALANFQRALTLENSGSVRNQAVDWFRYGKFLQADKVSPRLVFACFAKAEVLLQGDRNAESNETVDLPATIKAELNASKSLLDAATINSTKSELSSVLLETLALKL